MFIEKLAQKKNCELDSCKNEASVVVSFNRCGIISNIFICYECVNALQQIFSKCSENQKINTIQTVDTIVGSSTPSAFEFVSK
ncbi:MAG: hypothetical protein LBU60_03575 [Clostridiales bacterium]|jgi:hypothetical protein|nr:hypothetical protein [Clostridiales bacterium]